MGCQVRGSCQDTGAEGHVRRVHEASPAHSQAPALCAEPDPGLTRRPSPLATFQNMDKVIGTQKYNFLKNDK